MVLGRKTHGVFPTGDVLFLVPAGIFYRATFAAKNERQKMSWYLGGKRMAFSLQVTFSFWPL